MNDTTFAAAHPADGMLRAYFSGEPAARGVTLDLNVLDPNGLLSLPGYDPTMFTGRYMAVYRTPDAYRVLGTFDSPYAAAAALESFWTGMRALLAPA